MIFVQFAIAFFATLGKEIVVNASGSYFEEKAAHGARSFRGGRKLQTCIQPGETMNCGDFDSISGGGCSPYCCWYDSTDLSEYVDSLDSVDDKSNYANQCYSTGINDCFCGPLVPSERTSSAPTPAATGSSTFAGITGAPAAATNDAPTSAATTANPTGGAADGVTTGAPTPGASISAPTVSVAATTDAPTSAATTASPTATATL